MEGSSALLLGVAAGILAVILGGGLFMGMSAVKRIIAGRMIEMERLHRRQYADLSERVERGNERMNHDLQMIQHLLQDSTRANEERINRVLDRITLSLDQQQRQMKELRISVDTQLTKTLETRLGESFRQVSQQLERVYKGLGEMQTLAASVGDLKKVLTGVKTRGIWGETRLGALLEEMMSPEQYLTDTPVEPGSRERVEYAVKLPGRQDSEPVLLPIDSKCPQEDYQRLIQASQGSDKALVEKLAAALEKAILVEAKRIASKYIRVPHTTDFAVMFLPTEGLYAEALKRVGLAEKVQREYRVLICGPTTLSALLTSLQMGFRTLAVEQRSEEIWRLLGSVRDEFLKFGEALDRTRQHLNMAGADLDAASTRTRQITRELGKVDQLQIPDSWLDKELSRKICPFSSEMEETRLFITGLVIRLPGSAS